MTMRTTRPAVDAGSRADTGHWSSTGAARHWI